MLDSFEKESKLHERRAARQRQMRLMEQAASGEPLGSPGGGGVDDDGMVGSSPPTIADIENSGMGSGGGGGVFSIDDDDDDDENFGPTSVFTNAASANLWTSKTSKDMGLDAEKIGFITGDESPGSATGGGKGKKSWMTSSGTKRMGHDHNESRDLILMASRRLNHEVTPTSSGNSSTFNIEGGEDFRQRSRIQLPTCCLLYRRAICASLMILSLIVILLVAVVPNPKNKGDVGASVPPPWAQPWAQTPKVYDEAKFNRIKDRILEHGISHASTLEETWSPQYKALMWIVAEDGRQLDLPDRDDIAVGITGPDIDAEQKLFERYALATLWFQTNDLKIVQQSMTGKEVENMFDVPFDPLTLTEQDIAWNKNSNWMSSKGLCSWHGITCHPQEGVGQVYDDDFYVAILNLTANNVFGIVPREIYTGFNKLKALDLSRNELEGTVPEELGLLVDLEDLFLFDNNFSGVLPEDIGKLQNLYNLYINDNKFRGRIPAAMGDLTKLRGASMFNNTFTGRIPGSLGNLKEMIALYLDENELTGQVPTSLGLMSSMIDLRLRDNDLTGTIPTELGDLSDLETLYMDSNNRIGGRIPTELSKLSKLNELHLYQMDLEGPLPSELGLLTGLVYLYLDTNELTGPIPEEWGEMKDLEELFLTDNDLSGRLPETFRGMRSLQTLRAAQNNFSGPIPTDMGTMLKLEYVYLEENNFSGEVPSQLGELTKLKIMHLDDNSNLSGEIPDEICKLKTNFALRDLTADCDDILCTCCTCAS